MFLKFRINCCKKYLHLIYLLKHVFIYICMYIYIHYVFSSLFLNENTYTYVRDAFLKLLRAALKCIVIQLNTVINITFIPITKTMPILWSFIVDILIELLILTLTGLFHDWLKLKAEIRARAPWTCTDWPHSSR